MKITTEIFINKPTLDVWEIVGNQFGSAHIWASALTHTLTNAQQTKEVTMKKTNFKFNFVASWAVALSVFVGAGGAQYICARSNASSD